MLKLFIASAAVVAAVIGYNGHAGLGASVYQHNQTDLELVLMADMGGQFRG